MSTLSQFFPGAAGSGGGAPTLIGGLPSASATTESFTSLKAVAYNPVSGWYFMAVNASKTTFGGGSGDLYNKILASRDGINFSLSQGINFSNSNNSYVSYLATPDGIVNDASVLNFIVSQTTSIYASNDGNASISPLSFEEKSPGPNSTQERGLAYYEAGGRYYSLIYFYNITPAETRVYTSTDSVTWTVSSTLGGNVTSFSSRGRENGYATMSTSFFETDNGGLSWQNNPTPLPLAGSVVAGAEGTTSLVLSSGYYSTNDGQSWLPWASAPSGVTSLTSVAYSDKADRFIGWVNSANNAINGNMVVSTDGTGANWVYAAAGNIPLQAQLWGRTLGTSAAINFGTDLYYIAPCAGLDQQLSSPSASAIYVSKVDVATL